MDDTKDRHAARWPWHRKVIHALADEGMTRAEFAREIGETERSVRRWLREQNAPAKLETFIKIATYFGWSLDFLMDETRTYDEAFSPDDLRTVASALPPDVGRLVASLADPDRLAFLLQQLDVYERMQGVAERSQPSAPQGTPEVDANTDTKA